MRNPVHIFGTIIIFEAVSLLGFLYPSYSLLLFALVIAVVFLLAIFRPLDFLYLTFVELMIGGMGYLFSLRVFEFTISLRLALFSIALGRAFVYGLKEKTLAIFRESRLYGFWILFGFFIFFGVLQGFTRGYNISNIFFDVNGYLFLAYGWIWVTCIKTRVELDNFKPYAYSAGLYLALKTILIYFVFTHVVPFNIPLIYKWIRDTGVGELTSAPNGFYRVFFQSQIYLIAVWIYMILALFKEKNRTRFYFTFASSSLFMGALYMSLSRSFAVGILVTSIIILSVAFIYWRFTVKETFRAAIIMAGSFLGGLMIVLAVSFWPYPARHPFSLTAVWESRLTLYDQSVSSRWAELGPLWNEIKENWFLGAGFGKTVTYISNDPRVRAVSQGGEYTTTAFEWGYLDIWLKIGIIGLLAYLMILKRIFIILFKEINKNIRCGVWDKALIPATCVFSLTAVVLVHIFTPYLNHPLGFGILILTALLIDKK